MGLHACIGPCSFLTFFFISFFFYCNRLVLLEQHSLMVITRLQFCRRCTSRCVMVNFVAVKKPGLPQLQSFGCYLAFTSSSGKARGAQPQRRGDKNGTEPHTDVHIMRTLWHEWASPSFLKAKLQLFWFALSASAGFDIAQKLNVPLHRGYASFVRRFLRSFLEILAKNI